MGAELFVRAEIGPLLEEVYILLGQHCGDPAITIPVSILLKTGN
jgi:hypothetical protein